MVSRYLGQKTPTEAFDLRQLRRSEATAISRLANYPLAPLLIGFILGSMPQDNFSRSVQLYDGIAFVWERPMTLDSLVITIGLIAPPSDRAPLRQQGVADGD